MPRLRAPAVSALIALLSLALPAVAAPAPIVFDFEDGLQGWEIEGSVTRVQTQILSGQWAIFGDGPFEGDTTLSMEIDLTGIASISIEHFFVAGNLETAFIVVGNLFDGMFQGVIQTLDVIEAGNPSILAADVRSDTGVSIVKIAWDNGLNPDKFPSTVAFIDNITFHPVPEPSTLALLAGSLVALVIARRRMM